MKNIKFLSASIALVFLAGCSSSINNPDISATSQQVNSLSKDTASGDLVAKYLEKLARDDDPMKDVPAQPIEGTKSESLPVSKSTKQLTYFTYEALDNNLFHDLNRVVNTLEYIGSNDKLNIVAQTDSWKENNTARYYLTADNKPDSINSKYVQLGSESEASGDPKVFSDAVNWAFSTYPSKVKWLNMSTHGMGFAGIGYDDNPESNMSIVSFGSALRDGLKSKKLDLISFDACLMATVEVASELKDVSKVLIGSEDSTYYWGYGYYKTFSKVAQNPNIETDDIARSLVLDVNNKGTSNQTLTISATDLTKVDLLEKEIDNLAKALRKALPKYRADILRALQNSKPFINAQEIPFRDINRLLSLLKDNVKDSDVLESCDKINNVLYKKGVVILSRQSKLEKDQGRGLSIYVPTGGKVSKLYRETRFAKDTQWDEFLLDLNSTITPVQ